MQLKFLIMKNISIFFVVFLTVFLPAKSIAQVNDSNLQLGVYYMTGNSLGVNDPNSFLNHSVQDYRNGFVGVGLYWIAKLGTDSTKLLLRFLKIDLGAGSRTGTFDTWKGSAVRLSSASFDFDVMFPCSFKVAREVDAYAAFGPMISYRFSRIINPPQTSPDINTGNTFKTGFATELGFKFRSGSIIGYRTMSEFSDYPCRVGAIFFGFCPSAPKKKK
jgi:hypothetical protein